MVAPIAEYPVYIPVCVSMSDRVLIKNENLVRLVTKFAPATVNHCLGRQPFSVVHYAPEEKLDQTPHKHWLELSRAGVTGQCVERPSSAAEFILVEIPVMNGAWRGLESFTPLLTVPRTRQSDHDLWTASFEARLLWKVGFWEVTQGLIWVILLINECQTAHCKK